jgi:hypothetical protein
MVASIAGLFLTRRSADLRRYFGAIERVLYLAIIGWLSVFAVACTVRLRERGNRSTSVLADVGLRRIVAAP